jgi:general secretion pathway protein L
MRETLLLRADSVAGDHWSWLRLGEDGQPRGGRRAGALAEAAAEAAGLRVVVVVAGEECLLTVAQVPGRSRQKLLRAVPYALEEQLSDEVENLHFALGDALPEGGWPVAVISRRHMDELTAAFAGAALDVQQLVPEQLAIPRAEDEISALVSDGMTLVRSSACGGYAVDTENLGTLLALQAGESPPRLHLFIREGLSPPETDDYGAETVIDTWAGNPLDLLASGLQERSINLLQGDYSRTGSWAQLWKPMRATVALLLAALLVNFVVTGVEYFRLGKESGRLHAEIEQIFRKALPDAKRVVDPRAQMQQQLEKLQHTAGADNSFLALLGKAGPVLHETQGVEIASISFRAGRLDVDLKIGNLQQLDQLKQSLVAAGGLDVEIQSAAAGKDNRVQGRLRIQGKGA